MKRSILLPSAYLLDQIAGDPEWFPHPVRLIGSAISGGESALRHPNQSSSGDLASGAVLTLAVVGSAYWLTAAAIEAAQRRSRTLGDSIELLLGWTCLAARSLEQEASSVTNALRDGDLSVARTRLARIVGRDTAELDSGEISRAVIETAAESASDGVVAPLFYMAIGGVPLSMAYKAINTLDSMIGHADENYFYFGKVAARLDDIANYLPARITALALVGASQFFEQSDSTAGWQTWLRDGAKHKSPNAGQPESAIAGALHVALGGENTYAGERIPAARIGEEFAPPNLEKANQAIRLVSTAALLGLTLAVLLTTLLQRKEPT
jgi:adenosylcobinamide-phosphate synthase